MERPTSGGTITRVSGVTRPAQGAGIGRMPRVTRLPSPPIITRPAPIPDEPRPAQSGIGLDLRIVASLIILGHLAILVAASIGALPHQPVSPWLATLVVVRLTGATALLHGRRWGLVLYLVTDTVLLTVAALSTPVGWPHVVTGISAALLLTGVALRNWRRLQ